MANTLKVYLKFTKAKDGKLVSFVTKTKKENGSVWRGCWEKSKCKKRIVVLGQNLSVEQNKLYKVTLVQMKESDGFVAVSATPVKFKARLESRIAERGIDVKILFGNKSILYSPYSADKKYGSLVKVIDTIRKRSDISNQEELIGKLLEITAQNKIWTEQERLKDESHAEILRRDCC